MMIELSTSFCLEVRLQDEATILSLVTLVNSENVSDVKVADLY
jgi:hypothetical protein